MIFGNELKIEIEERINCTQICIKSDARYMIHLPKLNEQELDDLKFLLNVAFECGKAHNKKELREFLGIS